MSDNQTQVANEPPVSPFDEKEIKFRFRKDKELGTQRPSIVGTVNVPNVHGIVEIINNGFDENGNPSKELELLLDAVADTVRGHALDLVNNDENITSENFPSDKITWQYIANLDRTDRRSSSIPEETWEEWAKHYMEIMPALTAKTEEQTGNAVKVFLKKFAPAKTNKNVLKRLKEQLAIYTAHTTRGEEFSEILELLDRKVDNYLKAEDVEQLLNNL